MGVWEGWEGSSSQEANHCSLLGRRELGGGESHSTAPLQSEAATLCSAAWGVSRGVPEARVPGLNGASVAGKGGGAPEQVGGSCSFSGPGPLCCCAYFGPRLLLQHSGLLCLAVGCQHSTPQPSLARPALPCPAEWGWGGSCVPPPGDSSVVLWVMQNLGQIYAGCKLQIFVVFSNIEGGILGDRAASEGARGSCRGLSATLSRGRGTKHSAGPPCSFPPPPSQQLFLRAWQSCPSVWPKGGCLFSHQVAAVGLSLGMLGSGSGPL